jgi:hypothetical protein
MAFIEKDGMAERVLRYETPSEINKLKELHLSTEA